MDADLLAAIVTEFRSARFVLAKGRGLVTLVANKSRLTAKHVERILNDIVSEFDEYDVIVRDMTNSGREGAFTIVDRGSGTFVCSITFFVTRIEMQATVVISW